MAFQFKKSGTNSKQRKIKILVADDSITIQKLVNLSLAGGSYEIITSLDGHDAKIKIKRLKPDLVLIDANLREISGFQLCEEIRSEPALNGVKTVLLCAQGVRKNTELMDKAGADAVLDKPFDSKSLLDIIDRLLGNAQSEQPPAEAPDSGGDADEETVTRKSVVKPAPATDDEEPTQKRGFFSSYREADEVLVKPPPNPKSRLDAVAKEVLPSSPISAPPAPPAEPISVPEVSVPQISADELRDLARQEIRHWIDQEFPAIAERILKEEISRQLNKGDA